MKCYGFTTIFECLKPKVEYKLFSHLNFTNKVDINRFFKSILIVCACALLRPISIRNNADIFHLYFHLPLILRTYKIMHIYYRLFALNNIIVIDLNIYRVKMARQLLKLHKKNVVDSLLRAACYYFQDYTTTDMSPFIHCFRYKEKKQFAKLA